MKGRKAILFLSALFLLITFFPVAQKFFKSKFTKESKAPIELGTEAFNVLVLGSYSSTPRDLRTWHGRSDLILLISIVPQKPDGKSKYKVSLISIPRDTWIEIKKNKRAKINSANAIGGQELAKKAVQDLLGIKIQHVLLFNIAGFKELMNSVGSLKIYVPQKMSYHDHKADLHIEIEPGLQEMDSETLINFLRFRSDNLGDIGRIKRQHIFFRAALRKLFDSETVFKLPSILHKANEVFLTDMSFEEMFKIGLLLRSLSASDFKSYMVPGDFGKEGKWVVDEVALQEMMDQIKN